MDLARNKDYNTLLNCLTPESIVMDFGCATGIVSNAIADKVREIHGIDVSPRMVDIAQRIAGEKGLGNAHYSTATLFDAAFPRASFDVIYAFRVLHVLPDVQATLQQIHELLKHGGTFVSVYNVPRAMEIPFWRGRLSTPEHENLPCPGAVFQAVSIGGTDGGGRIDGFRPRKNGRPRPDPLYCRQENKVEPMAAGRFELPTKGL